MNSRNWEEDSLKKDIENLKRYYVQKKAARCKTLDPEMRLELVKSGSLNRIAYHFRKSSFAVLPGYHFNQGRKKNFENEYKLTRKIRQIGYCYVPVITFWEHIGDRALFIQKLRGEGDAEELAAEFRLDCFLVGKNGDWAIYKTHNLELLDYGSELKIIDVDVDFHRYCKIQEKKDWLGEQLKNIQEKHEKVDSHQVAGLRRRLRDLEKLEGELVC